MVSRTVSQTRVTSFIQHGNFGGCEGMDAANYTYVDIFDEDAETCTSIVPSNKDKVEYLITCQPNGQKVVNILVVLAQSFYPNGGHYQIEDLYLVQSGNLEGKFAYINETGLTDPYQKKCSSVLGRSYLQTATQELLIADKLDLNIFLKPAGAYATFKKSASTICPGSTFVV